MEPLTKLITLIVAAAVYTLALIVLMARRNPFKHYKGWLGITLICVSFYYIATYILE